jgi:hypothetical protein
VSRLQLVIYSCCLCPVCSYVFHEVRGPLNNMRLGMDLLVANPAVAHNAEVLEMVSSKSGCGASASDSLFEHLSRAINIL